MDNCPVCSKPLTLNALSASALDVYQSPRYVYGQCYGCDILVLRNGCDEKQKIDYSNSGYYQRNQPVAKWLIDKIIHLFMRWRIRQAKKAFGNTSLKGKFILDIGCGKGKFLIAAKQEGAIVAGVEPTLHSFEFARLALGDDVKNMVMSKNLFPPKMFDMITLWHVFEHIPNPIAMLDICATALRSTGILIIAIPNYKGLMAAIGGAVWFNLDPPRHVVHYSGLSLVRLLENNGFETLNMSYSYPELAFLSALQTLLNRLPITKNFLFNFLKKNRQAMSPLLHQYFFDVFLTVTCSILVAPFLLFLIPVLSFFKLSDCITIYASKKCGGVI